MMVDMFHPILLKKCPECGKNEGQLETIKLDGVLIGYEIRCECGFGTNKCSKTRQKAILIWNSIDR